MYELFYAALAIHFAFWLLIAVVWWLFQFSSLVSVSRTTSSLSTDISTSVCQVNFCLMVIACMIARGVSNASNEIGKTTRFCLSLLDIYSNDRNNLNIADFQNTCSETYVCTCTNTYGMQRCRYMRK